MDELLKSAAAFLDNDSLQVKFTSTTLKPGEMCKM